MEEVAGEQSREGPPCTRVRLSRSESRLACGTGTWDMGMGHGNGTWNVHDQHSQSTCGQVSRFYS